nr:DUF6527 family protein [uncultured Allomuricauda sp.]
MMRFQHRFIEKIPQELEERVLYISLEYGTIIHKCACGCGTEVNTPLSPNEWKMTYDGETISLKPSIGNWSFECQSHYWITKNLVEWSIKWDKDEIQLAREIEDLERGNYYFQKNPDHVQIPDRSNRRWFDRFIFW